MIRRSLVSRAAALALLAIPLATPLSTAHAQAKEKLVIVSWGGTWRMMPTEGPYMLKDTFPALLHGAPAPQEERVWELSRFAIETEGDSKFGFAERAIAAMRGIVEFADKQGIDKYVTVTTTAIERLLRHTGVDTSRMGPPLQIGVERAVALEIHLGEKTRTALFGKAVH